MIKASNITLSYVEKQNVIENCSFSIAKNDFIVITGKSGSGKSTLLKALYGELTPLSGELEVNGVDLTHKNVTQLLNLRKQTGIVFQDYQLIEDYTVEENIMLPLKINNKNQDTIEEQTKKLLSIIKLSHKADAYPDQLSGGEQQRVAVARALVHNPKIVFADEPTGNLDKFSADVIWSLLQEANQMLDVTVIVVTHTIPTNLNVDFKTLTVHNGVVNEIS